MLGKLSGHRDLDLVQHVAPCRTCGPSCERPLQTDIISTWTHAALWIMRRRTSSSFLDRPTLLVRRVGARSSGASHRGKPWRACARDFESRLTTQKVIIMCVTAQTLWRRFVGSHVIEIGSRAVHGRTQQSKLNVGVGFLREHSIYLVLLQSVFLGFPSEKHTHALSK